MKLKSLYEYYRAYFDYPRKNNRYYGRAVGEMSRISREVLKTRSTKPLYTYLQGRYCNSITKEMIKKLFWISINTYEEPLKEIFYFNTLVDINRNLITSRHRGIQIPIEFGIDYFNNEIIFLVYSSNYNISLEGSVLKGLFKEFNLLDRIPVEISTMTYWNISKGVVDKVDFDSLIPADRKSLINAANKIE